MKITTELKLDLNSITSWRNVRSDLATTVQEYWVGRKNSNIGMQYLRFEKGRIKATDGWERKDLFVFQHPQAFNVFVEPDGRTHWNLWDGVEVTPAEQKKVEEHIRKVLSEPDNQEYITFERTFLESKPWMQVDGMTPEEAVAKFTELGYPPKEK